MDAKLTTILLLLLTPLIFSFSYDLSEQKASVPTDNFSLMKSTVKLCSGETLNFGRCTGSVYCRACKTCEYCAHCNNGGSCGVCGKRRSSKKNYSSYQQYQNSQNYSNSRTIYTIPSTTKETYSFDTYEDSSGATYTVTLATSLRALPTSKSKVLQRFKNGDRVVLLQHYNEWWSKVRFNGQEGWVKRKLLK